MPAKVILKVTKGKLQGQEFAFAERTTCIVGRADGCQPQLPEDEDHQTISRHHCLLDINPPDVRVRDFGSLNGTYINGKKIGQRPRGQTPEEAAEITFLEHDLKEGDKIELGNTVLQVGIFVPAVCEKCGTEIPQDQKAQAERAPGVYLCPACCDKAGAVPTTELFKSNCRLCTQCGRDVSGEMGEHRQGQFVCATCKADPLHIVQSLLALAETGDETLLPIQGYAILKELGRGGMGAVYLARHIQTGEQVALKVMLPRVAVDEPAKELFLREIENIKSLRHPHVVQLRDAGFSYGTFFFTMELCEGGSVSDLLNASSKTLPIDHAGKIILQALEGLDYAHTAEIQVKQTDGTLTRSRGLVHRDVKPPNLFLSGTGSSLCAKVGDFGLAKSFDNAGLSGLTMTGSVAGTPAFMPRQQIIDFKHALPEVDVWAMAASFYFMLTGIAPRDFPPNRDPWLVTLTTSAIPIRQRNGMIPKKLAEVIDYALIDQPTIQCKTAAEFKRALESVL
jgi:serine/threonine-protein kinase